MTISEELSEWKAIAQRQLGLLEQNAKEINELRERVAELERELRHVKPPDPPPA